MHFLSIQKIPFLSRKFMHQRVKIAGEAFVLKFCQKVMLFLKMSFLDPRHTNNFDM
jgi:hypothetical protein